MTMWLSVPASVVNCYLPLSPSMKLGSPSISWLHKYSFSVTRYRVRIGGKTPTHCQWVLSLSTVSSELAACVRVLRICTTHQLVHSWSNCLLNLLAYFVFQTLSVAADRIWRIPLGKRAAVQRTTASTADAMGPLFTTFCACAHNCIYIPRMREV